MPNITIEFVSQKRKPGEYADEKLRGFILRVSDTGVKSYLIRARVKGGKPVSHTIGKHGSPWNARTAREEAKRILCMMKLGIDPRDEMRELRAKSKAKDDLAELEQQKRELTLRKVFEEWCADQRKVKQSTKTLYKQVLFKHLADWLDKPLVEITPEMCVRRYDKVADETTASANNAFRALRLLFNWEIGRQEDRVRGSFITSNPVSVLSPCKRDKWRAVKPRDSAIADDDLQDWFGGVQALRNKTYSDYFTLLIVTGLRKDEAAGLRWADVKFKTKSFTVRDTKNGRDHCLPMTPFVFSLLRRREVTKQGEYVFGGDGKFGHIIDVRDSQQKIIKASRVEFSPHSLRRTFSYAAARLRLSEAERKALLNHLKRSDVTDAHYTPWKVDALREPLRIVEEYILKLAGIDAQPEAEQNLESNKVVSIKRAGR